MYWAPHSVFSAFSRELKSHRTLKIMVEEWVQETEQVDSDLARWRDGLGYRHAHHRIRGFPFFETVISNFLNEVASQLLLGQHASSCFLALYP